MSEFNELTPKAPTVFTCAKCGEPVSEEAYGYVRSCEHLNEGIRANVSAVMHGETLFNRDA